jgi:hypothetical protein
LLYPELTPFGTPLALLINTLFAALQLGGVKLGAAIQQTAAVAFGLIMLGIAIALYYAWFANGTAVADPQTVVDAAQSKVARYGLVAAAVIYTYDGWFAPTSFSGETKEGGRATALGSIRGVMIVIAVYLLLNLAVVLAVPLSALSGHNLALSGAIDLAFGGNAGMFVIFAALFILMSHHNTQYMIATRTIYALSVDGLGSDHATSVSDKGTPTGALLFTWLAMPDDVPVHRDLSRDAGGCLQAAPQGAGYRTAVSGLGLSSGWRGVHRGVDRDGGVYRIHGAGVSDLRDRAFAGFRAGLLVADAFASCGKGGVAVGAPPEARSLCLAGFEGVRIQVVPGQEFVEVRAIAFCQPRRLAHIPHRDLQNL